MTIEYQCDACGNKFDKMYKSNADIKQKVKCKQCGKMAKKTFPLVNFVMKTGGTRNKK